MYVRKKEQRFAVAMLALSVSNILQFKIDYNLKLLALFYFQILSPPRP
jgi:hypothetical protein